MAPNMERGLVPLLGRECPVGSGKQVRDPAERIQASNDVSK